MSSPKYPKFNSPILLSILRLCDEQGWRWRVGSRHVVLYPPDGSRPLILSMTAYDGPINKQMVRRFQRAGMKGEPR